MSVSFAANAQTKATVVVAGGQSRSGFVDALRIQLSGVADVAVQDPLVGATITERTAAAGAIGVPPTVSVGAVGVVVVVWFEEAAGDQPDRPDQPGRADSLHLVGRVGTTVRTEIFRAAAAGADADRSLALKVRSVVEALLLPAVAFDPLTPPPPPPPPPPPLVEPSADEGTPAPWLEAQVHGLLPVGSPAVQAAFAAAGGVEWTRGSGYLAVVALAGVATPMKDTNDNGEVEVWELLARVGARLGRERGPWRLGGSALVGTRLVFADGVTVGGARGDGVFFVPTLTGLGEVWWSPPRLAHHGGRLRVAVGGEFSPQRQRFTLNQRPVLDLGRARPIVELGVLFSLP